jgi:hypothetical protein
VSAGASLAQRGTRSGGAGARRRVSVGPRRFVSLGLVGTRARARNCSRRRDRREAIRLELVQVRGLFGVHGFSAFFGSGLALERRFGVGRDVRAG